MKIPPKFKEYAKNAFNKADEAFYNVKTEYVNLTTKPKLERLEEEVSSLRKKSGSLAIKVNMWKTLDGMSPTYLQAQKDLALSQKKLNKTLETYENFSKGQAAAQYQFEMLNGINK